jgi:hypothetical protein
LDKNVILGRLAPLNANEKHIVAVLAIISLSLVSYRVLTKTQIQWVIKNFFTDIVPVGTHISAGVGIAYKTLHHTTIMDLPSESLREKLARMWYKIRKYVPIPLDIDANLLNEIPDDVFEAEVNTEDDDIFYGSVQHQNEEMSADAVSYQQPKTHPLSSSISRK